MSLAETIIFMSILGVMFMMLAETVVISSEGSQIIADHASSHGQVERLFGRLTGELQETTTSRGHDDSIAPDLLNAVNLLGSEESAVYNWPLVRVDTLHMTDARDGVEYWHDVMDDRRFYVYATYTPFDTIEFQKIRVPTNPGDWARFLSDGALDPWGTPRKIFLENGDVVLRVFSPAGDRNLVLARGIEGLEFHIDDQNRIVIRVSVLVRTRGQMKTVSYQRAIATRGRLF